MNVIIGLIILVFFIYVTWHLVKKKGKLPSEGFFADEDGDDVPDGINKAIDKIKKKK